MFTPLAFNKESIVTRGLVFHVDAADRTSYVSGSGVWNDLTGNGNNGTLTNGPGFDGANGGSISFDGSDDLINCGNNTILDLNTHSICFWYNPQNGVVKEIIVKSNNTNSGVGPYEVFQGSSKIYYRLNSGAVTKQGSILLNINEWNYIVATYDQSYMKTYINTTPDVNHPFTSPLSISTGDLCIGSYADIRYNLQAQINSIQIYNRALTPSEITQNYNALKGRFGL